MTITIVGGGNIGTQFAVHCAEKGHDVIIYTSTPKVFIKHLKIVDDNGTTTHEGDIAFATNNPDKAFSETDLIIVTLPPMLMQGVAEIIYKYCKAKTIIGVVPGYGGCECAFRKCIEKGNIFFGIERVPAIARLEKRGQTVKSTGYRDELHISSLPFEYVEECAEIMKGIFDIPCKVIPNFLNLTLTPSNPILHTTRLKTIFKGWHEGITYEKLPLFYEEWDNETSRLLLACDNEIQEICKALSEYNLKYVKSLRNHYEAQTPEELTKKISSISAFKGIKTPAIECNGKYKPDLSSRYFVADFSYGLTVIRQVAWFADIATPNIDSTLDWYKAISVEKAEFRYSDYGIYTRSDFNKFYLQ